MQSYLFGRLLKNKLMFTVLHILCTLLSLFYINKMLLKDFLLTKYTITQIMSTKR